VHHLADEPARRGITVLRNQDLKDGVLPLVRNNGREEVDRPADLVALMEGLRRRLREFG
jgi:hypothetical protein